MRRTNPGVETLRRWVKAQTERTLHDPTGRGNLLRWAHAELDRLWTYVPDREDAKP